MLSKEEIEKAKNEGYEIIRDFRKATTEFTKDILPKKANAIKTLIEGIEQLETENKELKADKQRLIEKLEKDIKKNNEFEFMPLQIEEAYNNYYKIGRIDEAQEILEILKGEK